MLPAIDDWSDMNWYLIPLLLNKQPSGWVSRDHLSKIGKVSKIKATGRNADSGLCCVFCCNAKVHLTDLLTRRTWASSNIWAVWSKRACDCFPQCPSLPAALVKIVTSVSYRWMMTLEWNIHLLSTNLPWGCILFIFLKNTKKGDYYHLKIASLCIMRFFSIVFSDLSLPDYHRAALNIKLGTKMLSLGVEPSQLRWMVQREHLKAHMGLKSKDFWN